jgi:nitroreductase
MPTLTAPARLLCLWNEADSVMQITTVRRRRAAFSSLIHLEVGSWFDYGLLAQTFMLAAKARGLNTCPQISLTKYHTVIRRHLPIDDSQIIACGMSIGCADTGSIEYTINIPRIPVNEFACIVGLE